MDNEGKVLLTDFGLGLIASATAFNYGSKHGGGGYAHRAPELHDPLKFSLETDRPTPATDIYAFACVAIEVTYHYCRPTFPFS